MRVAATCRHHVRKVFSDYDVVIAVTDAELNTLVRKMRSTLNAEGIGAEAYTLVDGLLPWRNCLLQHVTEELDHDDWCRLLWDCYTSATNGTQEVANQPGSMERYDRLT